jgi:uncharacterized protein (TIGR02599 family)
MKHSTPVQRVSAFKDCRGAAADFAARRGGRRAVGTAGFTLVEILVGCSVLLLLLVMLLSVTDQTMRTVKTASAQVDAFQAARTAFDLMSQKVSQATMNTYWDYYDASNQPRTPSNATTFVPARYGRASDLHFLIQASGTYGHAIFFQAPEAISADPTRDQTQGLLNAIGYFVQFGNDDAYRPPYIQQQRYRYRLMQAIQPTENLQVFTNATGSWTAGVREAAWPLVDNVIALVIWPRLNPLEDPNGTVVSSNYLYDSRTALPASSSQPFPIQFAQAPPTVQLTMLVIDEASAVRIEAGTAEPPVIRDALTGRFTSVSSYQSDLDAIQAALSAAHVSFRVLNTTVSLRESKWSTQ